MTVRNEETLNSASRQLRDEWLFLVRRTNVQPMYTWLHVRCLQLSDDSRVHIFDMDIATGWEVQANIETVFFLFTIFLFVSMSLSSSIYQYFRCHYFIQFKLQTDDIIDISVSSSSLVLFEEYKKVLFLQSRCVFSSVYIWIHSNMLDPWD